MTDHRRARQLGQGSLLVMITLFAVGSLAIAFMAASESMLTWDP